ncbi:hypothetical protein BDR06DRAFT_974252 [Suillus hirtellus]|nr:hypothetical protein BDR06DRAFT_974252 [Suillus hirtellus]
MKLTADVIQVPTSVPTCSQSYFQGNDRQPRSHSVIDSDINDDLDNNMSITSHLSPIDLTDSPVIIENPLPEDIPSHSSQQTQVSPGLQLLNLNPPPPPRASQPSLPTRPRSVYMPSQPPSLIDFAALDRDVRASGPELLQNAVWHVRSSSLEVMVKGLLAFIIQARHYPAGPFHAPPDLPTHFTLIPHNVRLHEIWSMHWLFRVFPSTPPSNYWGNNSLVDSAWLEAVLPDTFNVLKLFPSSAGAAQDFSHLTPQEVLDLQRILCHVGKQTLAQLSCTRAAQWPNMIRALHASLLLGVRAPQLHESTIYAAFCQGLDQALSSTHHSFIDAIADSSKFLLYGAYSCHHLNSPLQLFPLLSFDILGDADFENDMATLLPNLREHVEHYFKGVRHPDDPLFTNLVSSTQLATDNQDLISGITLLPPGLKDFTIAIHQDISISATFNGHYDVHYQSTIVSNIL